MQPLVLERSGIAAEASGVQPGGVRQQWSSRLSCELARESFGVYRDLDARLEVGLPLRFDECGYLLVAHGEERLRRLEQIVALQNEVGVPSRIVGPDEAAELAPGLDATAVVGASWCAEDGYFDRPADGRRGVRAGGAGARAPASRSARSSRSPPTAPAGASSSATDRPSGRKRSSSRPATTHRRSSLRSASSCRSGARPGNLFFSDPIRERILEPLVVSAEWHFAAKQLADGRVLASDLSAAGDPEQGRAAWREHVRGVVDRLLPVLTHVSFPLLVTGFYDVTPDNQPILGPVAGLEGLHVAAGFSGHGFMLAPAVGRRVASAALGGALDPVLQDLSLDRFAAGSPHLELETV